MAKRNKIIKFLSQQSIYIFVFLLLIGTVIINLSGCCTYSFTGSSVPAHIHTVAIPIAEDRSGAGLPGLRELLTQGLIREFIDDNSLQVTDRTQADAIIECTIVSYSDAPSIVAAGENVEQRRVTVTVRVLYKDLVKRVSIFDKNFSNFGDYKPGTAQNERVLASEVALDKITEDILLAVVSGW